MIVNQDKLKADKFPRILHVSMFGRYLSRVSAVPGNLFIGDDCVNGHGVNGETVRRKERRGRLAGEWKGVCVVCEREKARRYRKKEYREVNEEKSTHHKKMRAIEDAHDDGDPFLI